LRPRKKEKKKAKIRSGARREAKGRDLFGFHYGKGERSRRAPEIKKVLVQKSPKGGKKKVRPFSRQKGRGKEKKRMRV